MSVLSIQGLCVEVPGPRGGVRVVDGVNLEVPPGRTVGLVGESGSGKTLTALSILRLLTPPARVSAGRVALGDRDLFGLEPEQLRQVRGREIGMIFQEPGAALDPVMPVGDQIAEAILAHESVGWELARERAVALLARVGIPEAERRSRDFPHQFSGGMQQRVVIATAVACGPSFLIADEPTTALDVTWQAQIVELVQDLQRETNMGVLWITHDLALLAGIADEIAVMYGGVIVERAPAKQLFAQPAHPYTILLLRSLGGREVGRLQPVPGMVPEPGERPDGCRFRTRCPLAEDVCAQQEPVLEEIAGQQGHTVRCARVEEARSL